MLIWLLDNREDVIKYFSSVQKPFMHMTAAPRLLLWQPRPRSAPAHPHSMWACTEPAVRTPGSLIPVSVPGTAVTSGTGWMRSSQELLPDLPPSTCSLPAPQAGLAGLGCRRMEWHMSPMSGTSTAPAEPGKESSPAQVRVREHELEPKIPCITSHSRALPYQIH